MLLKDKLQTMSKEQLVKQIGNYEKQADSQKDMPKNVKCNHLFGSSIEENLELARKELASRKENAPIIPTRPGVNGNELTK